MWSCSQEERGPGAAASWRKPLLAHALYVQVSAWAPGPCCPRCLQGLAPRSVPPATLGLLPPPRISEVMGPGQWRAGVCLLTSLVCGKLTPRASLPPQSACALEAGAARPPPPRGQTATLLLYPQAPTVTVGGLPPRPCLWLWRSSLRRERSSHCAHDPAPLSSLSTPREGTTLPQSSCPRTAEATAETCRLV